jgi:uncharacterized membrane protein
MAFCAKCGAQMTEGTTFCGSCGAAAGGVAPGSATAPPAAPAAAGTGGGLTPNVAGALAYITLLPAILFLVIEPYNKDRFIRFHSFQSIFFGVAWLVLWIGLFIIHFILAFIPVIGWILALILAFVLWLVLGLGGFVLWIFLVYKAYNYEKFMLPVIGKLAEQQASR